MDIKKFHKIADADTLKTDTIDLPDCFGEFDIQEKLCAKYCAVSLRCSAEQVHDMKNDILDRLLSFDASFLKPQ